MVQPATRVFLVDDHEIVRGGLRDMIESTDDLRVVGEAGTAAEARSRIPAVDPDVVVMDVRLPDGNGVEVCQHVHQDRPDIRFLMLTSYSDDEALLNAVLAGASGYVLKQIRGTELMDSIRAVAEGRTLLDEKTVAKVNERLRTDGERDERIRHLTGQERRILEHIAQGQSNRQIADDMGLAEKTVKNYVSNVLAKLGVAHRTEAAIYAAQAKRRAAAGTMGRATSR